MVLRSHSAAFDQSAGTISLMTMTFNHETSKWMFELSEVCARLADDIAEKHSSRPEQAPLVGLNMAHAPLVQCCEILDHYYGIWRQIDPAGRSDHEKNRILSDNEGRVSLAQRSAFIFIMSAFEAAAKLAIKLPRAPFEMQGGRVYFSGIMRQSWAEEMIDEEDAKLWRFAIELRNCIVHNNAVADLTMSLVLENGSTIDMAAGRMSQSTPRKNVLLLKAIVLAYGRWCDSFLASVRAD